MIGAIFMKLFEHYLHLQSTLSAQEEYSEVQVSFKITIEEIADVLCCTKRHTKFIIKQFLDMKWITWEVVRGRGKRSTLTFLRSKDEVIREQAKELVKQGKYQQAFEHLGSVSTPMKEEFHDWLHGQLGVMIERKNEKEIDVLRYPFYNALKSLDPAMTLSRHEGHLVEHLFDTLLRFDAEKEELQPHIAHYWEEQEGGRIWTFYLRKGVTFHHGREMTAEDVLQSIQRLKDMSSPHHDSWMFASIKEMKAIRSTVVQFILQKPDYLFPHYLCHNQASIIPIEIWKNDSDLFSKKPIGTGPFKLVQHDNRMVVLEAYEPYFNGRAHLDRIEMLTLPDLYPNNNQHIFYWLTKGDQEQKWDKIDQVAQGASYISFNLNKAGPQQHLSFRKAISLALDLELMSRELVQQKLSAAYSLLPARSVAYQKETYDPDKAKQLLQESGYIGDPITIYATELRKGADHKPEVYWIQAQLEKIGVRSHVEVLPIEDIAQPAILQQSHLVLSGVGLSQNTILSLMKTFQAPTAFIKNMVGDDWANMIDKKMNEVKEERDRDKQMKILIELEEQLYQDYAIYFIRHRTFSVNVSQTSSLEGVSMNWSGRINYKDVWFRSLTQ
jgi:SgrR family transcriptional regulator